MQEQLALFSQGDIMKEYLDYLKSENKKADNTLLAYERDIRSLEDFLKTRTKALDSCTEGDAVAYVLDLKNQNMSRPTINRRISSLRAFYEYKKDRGVISSNPFTKLKSSKAEARDISFLTVEEVFALLELPDETPKGVRDRALLEFMYGTGIRVTELVRMKCEDVNLRMNFATIKDANEESRIVPLGRYAHDALADYLKRAYSVLKGSEPESGDYLFINRSGECLTRQGIWKILKEYGKKLGIEDKMTPQVLRDSFAVHILQNGGDLRTLQELMGFDDMSAGIAYLALTELHVKDVFSRTHPRA